MADRSSRIRYTRIQLDVAAMYHPWIGNHVVIKNDIAAGDGMFTMLETAISRDDGSAFYPNSLTGRHSWQISSHSRGIPLEHSIGLPKAPKSQVVAVVIVESAMSPIVNSVAMRITVRLERIAIAAAGDSRSSERRECLVSRILW